MRVNQDFVDEQDEAIADEHQDEWQREVRFQNPFKRLPHLTLSILLFHRDRYPILKSELRLWAVEDLSCLEVAHVVLRAGLGDQMDEGNRHEDATAEGVGYPEQGLTLPESLELDRSQP